MTATAIGAANITAADLLAAVPSMDGEVKLAGLHDTVTVWRDNLGIPHVRAVNEHDAWFAQGFVTAQDRLWAMEFDRRRAVGRWAEAAGPSAIGQDMQIRRHRLEDSARADYAAAGPRARAMLDAYAAGVNAFINSDAPLPVEYAITGIEPEPWEPWHGLAIYKVRHIFMGVFESKAWRARLVKELGPERAAELFPSYPPGQPVIIPTGADYDGPVDIGLQQMLEAAADLNFIGETDSGSNSWVISGSIAPPPASPSSPVTAIADSTPPACITRTTSPAIRSTSSAFPSPACRDSPTLGTTDTSPGASPTPPPTTRTFTSSGSTTPTLLSTSAMRTGSTPMCATSLSRCATGTMLASAPGPPIMAPWSAAIRCPAMPWPSATPLATLATRGPTFSAPCWTPAPSPNWPIP